MLTACNAKIMFKMRVRVDQSQKCHYQLTDSGKTILINKVTAVVFWGHIISF